jgi:hypothetical protein
VVALASAVVGRAEVARDETNELRGKREDIAVVEAGFAELTEKGLREDSHGAFAAADWGWVAF